MYLNENKISIAGVAVALAALVVSIKSCQQSEKALDFQNQERINEVTTVWKGDVNEADSTIKINPSNNNVLLQKAKVSFPEKISDVVWPIDMPDHVLHMTSQKIAIQDLVEKRIPKVDGHTIVLDDSRVPIVIESRYVANAQIYEDRSLYLIEFSTIVWSDEYRKPSIKLNGIAFYRRLSPDENAKEVLNDLWEVKSKYVQTE